MLLSIVQINKESKSYPDWGNTNNGVWLKGEYGPVMFRKPASLPVYVQEQE